MRLPNLLINAALFLAATALSIALLFGIGELYFHLRTRGDTRHMPWVVQHPERGWALKPGEYTHLEPNDMRQTRISINELGMRNPPLSLAVPPGRRRVSVLGDSFVFGAALEDGETITGQMRALLGSGCEVVNLGVEGYGTGAEILMLEELAARGYAPGGDIVLVFFTNDILDNLALDYSTGTPAAHVPRFWVDSTGALQHTRPQLRSRVPWGRALERRWMFFRYVRSRAANLMLANPWLLELADKLGFHVTHGTPGVVEGFYAPAWEDRWGSTAAILGYFARESRERFGSRLTVAFVPSPFQVMETLQRVVARRAPSDSIFAAFLGDMDRPQRCLREFCAGAGVPFIDTTPALRRAARTRSPYLIEAHLNPYGARVVAEAIRGFDLDHPVPGGDTPGVGSRGDRIRIR